MEIRSITLFCNHDHPRASVGAFFEATDGLFDVPLQTRRVALPPFPDWWKATGGGAVQFLEEWQETGADYVCVGPAQLRHNVSWLRQLPDLLGAGDALFASAEIANTAGMIDPSRALEVAKLIKRASRLQENGFGNLYFTALANCPPGSPFFPVAYHDGGAPAFALAVEAADVALQAIEQAGSLAEAREALVAAIEYEAGRLTRAAGALAEAHELRFGGIDFSLAPFPTLAKSLGGALEAVGISRVGAPGTLFAATFIAEAIGRASFPRCGFSGLMLPVLEDAVLAERAAERVLSVNDLLSYAAVCGVGLDTIPLPGDVDDATLAAILLDVAALALRLDKPLTARLMPLPGLKAGDPVAFDFPYFADSRVMAISEGALNGPLGSPAPIEMRRLGWMKDSDR